MGLREDFENELTRLVNAAVIGPAMVTVQDAAGVQVRAELTAVETLGCAVSRVLVSAPHLKSADVAVLKQWSDELAERITYLLESLTPLETDEEPGRVLMRSAAPQTLPLGREYYECMLAAESHGSVSFRRYRAESGVAGRTAVDMTLTREVVGRLVGDLVETMPGP